MAKYNAEGGKEMKYPKSVFFIITNEFCERFSFYGMRTALSFYFADVLLYDKDTSTVMFHTFTMLVYFFPLLGAMVADSWLGKFRTILYLSIVYAAGQLILSVASVPWMHLPVRAISMLGLVLIALGTGGIKPCVSAFGGDQFKLPQQEAYLSTFFSLFYFAINSGSLISTFITPILRKDVTCYEQNTCYPLAFSVPAVLMIISVVVFFAGKSLYKVKAPEGNVVFEVTKCISHALCRKIKSKSKREHWMDYADDRYDRQLIVDIKSVLKVLWLFIPLPIFWALFDQQGSRWTFQATRMDGETFGYLIKPDQFQVVNPLFIVIFIPIFQYAVYPVIEKALFINTPLRKLTVGGFLAGLSFVISALVELKVEPTYAVLPSSGLAQIRIYNPVNCPAWITLNDDKFVIEALDLYQNLNIPVTNNASLKLSVEYKDCKNTNAKSFNSELLAEEEKAKAWVLKADGVSSFVAEDTVDKSTTGDPYVRGLIYQEAGQPRELAIKLLGKSSKELPVYGSANLSDPFLVNDGAYDVELDGKLVLEGATFKFGGVYSLIGHESAAGQTTLRSVEVVAPNSVHMFWLLPQYTVITWAEIMFSITGLEFAFTQAPPSMKSLLTASWLMTVALGNLIVVIITEARFFKRQMFEFILFAGLMFVDMAIFAVMAMFYKYVEQPSSNENSSSDDIDLDNKQGINNLQFVDEYELRA